MFCIKLKLCIIFTKGGSIQLLDSQKARYSKHFAQTRCNNNIVYQIDQSLNLTCSKFRFWNSKFVTLSVNRMVWGYQGLTVVYTWLWTFFPIIFKSFQNFSDSYNFILFKNSLLYLWSLIYLFVLGRDRIFTVCIYFEEALFFNFSSKLINISPYLRELANFNFMAKAGLFMEL